MTDLAFVPYLSVQDADKAVAFYADVFQVEPWIQLTMPDGRVMHCEFRIGSSRIFLSAELPEHGGTPSPTSLGATSVAVHLSVDDCDAMVQRMAERGAEILMEPVDMFWGERFGRVRDPFGHEWGVATVLRDMTPSEIQDATREMLK